MAKQNHLIPLLAQMFRILGDQTRLRVLAELRDGERNVSDLCRRLKVSQPTISRHLGILRMGGLVRNRRSGKEIFYSVSDLRIDPYARSLKALMRGASMIRLGPVILGLSKN